MRKEKNMRKRFFAFFMICCMIISVIPVTANAALPPQIEPQWTNTMIVHTNMSFNGSTGSVTVSITGRSGVSNISAEVKLYYKNSAGSWVDTQTSWSYSVNEISLIKVENFTGVAGREYKAVMTATVYKDGYAEPISKTATATCPTT